MHPSLVMPCIHPSLVHASFFEQDTHGVAAQHAYKAIGGATGSYNFGVVSIMGIPGMFVQSHNKNALRAQELRAELRGRIWNQIRPQLDTLVPGWSTWFETYRKQCSDIPPLIAVSEALPWNGEQF